MLLEPRSPACVFLDGQDWVSLEFGRFDILNQQALEELANPDRNKATAEA
jgi:hypothetical protein